jgi:hypothetical protein
MRPSEHRVHCRQRSLCICFTDQRNREGRRRKPSVGSVRDLHSAQHGAAADRWRFRRQNLLVWGTTMASVANVSACCRIFLSSIGTWPYAHHRYFPRGRQGSMESTACDVASGGGVAYALVLSQVTPNSCQYSFGLSRTRECPASASGYNRDDSDEVWTFLIRSNRNRDNKAPLRWYVGARGRTFLSIDCSRRADRGGLIPLP